MHHLLNILNYFAELRHKRHDDMLTAEWKSKQLRVWMGLLVLLVSVGLSVAAANILNTMHGNALLGPMSEQLRPAVAYLLTGGIGLAAFFTLYSWWSVIRFAKKHGIE